MTPQPVPEDAQRPSGLACGSLLRESMDLLTLIAIAVWSALALAYALSVWSLSRQSRFERDESSHAEESRPGADRRSTRRSESRWSGPAAPIAHCRHSR
jgi:hypothetical protein